MGHLYGKRRKDDEKVKHYYEKTIACFIKVNHYRGLSIVIKDLYQLQQESHFTKTSTQNHYTQDSLHSAC